MWRVKNGWAWVKHLAQFPHTSQQIGSSFSAVVKGPCCPVNEGRSCVICVLKTCSLDLPRLENLDKTSSASSCTHICHCLFEPHATISGACSVHGLSLPQIPFIFLGSHRFGFVHVAGPAAAGARGRVGSRGARRRRLLFRGLRFRFPACTECRWSSWS